MRQINLKSDGNGPERKRGVSLSVIIGLSLLIISGLIIGGFFLYNMQLQKGIDFADNEIDKRKADIDDQKFKEIYDLQGRIIDVKKYSNEANSQKEVLDVISVRTFSDTVFQDLNLEEASSSSSVVEASILLKDSDRLASQLNAYKQSDQIENLRLESSSLEEDGLAASVVFTVKTKKSSNK